MAGHLIALANDYFIEVIVHKDSEPTSCLKITVSLTIFMHAVWTSLWFYFVIFTAISLR